jgi:hypothetical protein
MIKYDAFSVVIESHYTLDMCFGNFNYVMLCCEWDMFRRCVLVLFWDFQWEFVLCLIIYKLCLSLSQCCYDEYRVEYLFTLDDQLKN